MYDHSIAKHRALRILEVHAAGQLSDKAMARLMDQDGLKVTMQHRHRYAVLELSTGRKFLINGYTG